MVSRPEPAGDRVRAGGCRCGAARSGPARRRRQDRNRQARRAVRRCRRRAVADGHAADAGHDREDDAASWRRDRVDALQRRHRRAQADDPERRPDPVSRDRTGWDVAGERCRLRLGARRRRCDSGGRRRAVQRCHARPVARRQGRPRRAVHWRDQRGHGGWKHAAGSGSDVSADVPAVHAAARGSGVRLPRSCHKPKGSWRISWRVRTSCSAARCIPR